MVAEGYSVSTVQDALNTIGKVHRIIGNLDPTRDSRVRERFRAVKRRPRRPATVQELRQLAINNAIRALYRR